MGPLLNLLTSCKLFLQMQPSHGTDPQWCPIAAGHRAQGIGTANQSFLLSCVSWPSIKVLFAMDVPKMVLILYSRRSWKTHMFLLDLLSGGFWSHMGTTGEWFNPKSDNFFSNVCWFQYIIYSVVLFNTAYTISVLIWHWPCWTIYL